MVRFPVTWTVPFNSSAWRRKAASRSSRSSRRRSVFTPVPGASRRRRRFQAVALNGDEGDDLLVGGRPCENREQQQMAQAIALSLRAAWIMDSFKRGKQRTKRHQGDLHQLRTSL